MSDSRLPIYFDHAATTPVVAEARAAMIAALETFGNASSVHGSGRKARRLLEESREAIAVALDARPSEVLFTSGGTESDNLAIKGIFWSRRAENPSRVRIISSAVEHHAVLDALEWLEKTEQAVVTLLPVDAAGTVDPQSLRSELERHSAEVALVTVMWANNEVGTIQPISELASIAAEFGIPMHSDAVQAAGHIAVSFAESGLAAMTIAGHKFGGPHGIGALVLGRGVAVTPLQHGGGHERDVRSGTANVVGAAGMAAALNYAVTHRTDHAIRSAALVAQLRAIFENIPGTLVNGPAEPAQRLPGHVHVSFPGCEGDSLLMLLDAQGIECSTGSACTAGVARASHVLLAMGISTADARASLRFTVAPSNTVAEISLLANVIGEVVSRARAAGTVTREPKMILVEEQ